MEARMMSAKFNWRKFSRVSSRAQNVINNAFLIYKKLSKTKTLVFVDAFEAKLSLPSQFRVVRVSHAALCSENYNSVKILKRTSNRIKKSIPFLRFSVSKTNFIIIEATSGCTCLSRQEQIKLSGQHFERTYFHGTPATPKAIIFQALSLNTGGNPDNRKSTDEFIGKEIGLLSEDFSSNISESNRSEIKRNRFNDLITRESSIDSQLLIQKYQAHDQKVGIHGLGDFIFGCLKIHEIATEFGRIPSIDISQHPISNFLHHEISETGPVINVFHDDHDVLFLRNKTVFTNKRPRFAPTMASRDFVLTHALRFSTFAEKDFQELVAENKLSAGRYSVTHLRIGDHQLLQTQEGSIELESTVNAIKRASSRNRVLKESLFLADSELIRGQLQAAGLRTLNSPVAHLGNLGSSLAAVKFSLMEYRILLRASSIFQISAYPWGSAFSETASILGNVPMTKMNLQDFIQIK